MEDFSILIQYALSRHDAIVPVRNLDDVVVGYYSSGPPITSSSDLISNGTSMTRSQPPGALRLGAAGGNPAGYPGMVQLRADEAALSRSQTVISSAAHGGRRYAPYAFTEHGVVMLAAVLPSAI